MLNEHIRNSSFRVFLNHFWYDSIQKLKVRIWGFCIFNPDLQLKPFPEIKSVCPCFHVTQCNSKVSSAVTNTRWEEKQGLVSKPQLVELDTKYYILVHLSFHWQLSEMVTQKLTLMKQINSMFSLLTSQSGSYNTKEKIWSINCSINMSF